MIIGSKFILNAILLQRFFQGLLGIGTIFFVAEYLSPNMQGWYYSFISLASFFALFELGLSVALIQISAHLFSSNKWLINGHLTGSGKEDFLGLLKKSLKVYLFIGLIFFAIMVPSGSLFFGSKIEFIMVEKIDWYLPWIFLVFFTTLNIFLLPFFSLIEGSGLVNEIYFIRFLQNLLGSLACWFFLIEGKGLWASVATQVLSFCVAILWLGISKFRLILCIFRKNYLYLSWGSEVWPLQWRVALGWLSGYLLTQIFTPVLFYYHGAQVAGQMGLSVTIANMLGLLSQSWIALGVPAMARAAKHRDWDYFDKIFRQNFTVSIFFYMLGIFILGLLSQLISGTKYAERVLSFWPFFGLLVIVFLNHITGALASQLRSYKKEPLVWVSLAGAIITVPISFISAAYYSVGGVVLSILLIQLLITLPISTYLWVKYNKEWRC